VPKRVYTRGNPFNKKKRNLASVKYGVRKSVRVVTNEEGVSVGEGSGLDDVKRRA